MKNNLDWIRHYTDAHNHPKFRLLKAEHGFEGLGRFWILCELIGASSACRLDLNEKYNKGAVAESLGYKLSELDTFLQFLADDCKLIKIENNIVTATEIERSYSSAKEDRESAKYRKQKTIPTKDESSGDVRREDGELLESSANFEEVQRTLEESKSKSKSKSKSSSSSKRDENGELLESSPRNDNDDNFFASLTEIEKQAIAKDFPLEDSEEQAILIKAISEYPLLPKEKHNYPYLRKMISGRLEDLHIKQRELAHKREKQKQLYEAKMTREEEEQKLKSEWQGFSLVNSMNEILANEKIN